MTDPESPGAVETAEARLVSALRELAKLSPLFGRSFANTALSDVPVSMPHVTFPTTVVAEWNVHYETLRLFACAVTGSDDPTPNDIHDHLRRQAFERSRRDAAVRREALLGVVRWLEQKANDVREVTRDCRREAIALKAAGKDWKDAFDRECLSSSRCSGFADAAEHVRALASGDSDG